MESTVDSQYAVGNPIWNNQGWRGFDAGLNLKSTVLGIIMETELTFLVLLPFRAVTVAPLVISAIWVATNTSGHLLRTIQIANGTGHYTMITMAYTVVVTIIRASVLMFVA